MEFPKPETALAKTVWEKKAPRIKMWVIRGGGATALVEGFVTGDTAVA